MNPGPSENAIHPQADAAEAPPQVPMAHRLAIPALKYLEGRSLLLRIETQEALMQSISLVSWLGLGAVAAFGGWLLLTTALVGALSMSVGWSWVEAVAVVGGVHILFAVAAALVMWQRLATARWFSDSLNELKKDRAWLKTQTTKN